MSLDVLNVAENTHSDKHRNVGRITVHAGTNHIKLWESEFLKYDFCTLIDRLIVTIWALFWSSGDTFLDRAYGLLSGVLSGA